MHIRPFFLLASFLTLHGCVDGPTMQRPSVTPVRGADPAALRMCVAKLDRVVARYVLLPDQIFSGGCSALEPRRARRASRCLRRSLAADTGRTPPSMLVAPAASG